MEETINQISSYLHTLATSIPVETFSIIGGFAEEIIAPIPSPFISTLVGTIASQKDSSLFYLILLSALISLGKLVACWIFYVVADKGEDIVVGRFGKFLGISHNQIEQLSKRLNKGWRDNLILIGLRALPIIPGSPVSVVCGLLKINMVTYITSTFIGNTIRSFIFVYFGYSGVGAYQEIIEGIDSFESIFKVIIVVGFAGVLGYLYYNREKNKS